MKLTKRITNSKTEIFEFNLPDFPNLHGLRIDSIEIDRHEYNNAIREHGVDKVFSYFATMLFTRF